MNLTQAVIAIANFVGDGLGRTIARIDALESNQIDAETKKRIMRCVHAWEKTVDTDNDAGNSGADHNDTSNTGVYDIRVKQFNNSNSQTIIVFELTENGSPVRLYNAPYSLKSGDKKHGLHFMSAGLYYIGLPYDTFELSIEFGGVTTTRTFNVIGNELVKAT